MLYIRMFLIMGVSLYTSRLILDILGIEDFGTYNVVGGIVAIFTFVNTAMVNSTQRFLNISLGKKDIETTAQVFSMSLNAHLLISFIIILVGETVGLWYFYTYLKLPPGREISAFWVYQISIISTVISIIRAPYNACIIAYEKMSAFAYISVLEVILKLVICYLLLFSTIDKLILYSFLVLCVTILITLSYYQFCIHHFPISKYKRGWNNELFKQLMSFSGWSLFGSIATMGATTGLNLLQNAFFGVVVNAAMGVANQVVSTIYSFSSNFQTAFNPQIVKLYAAGQKTEFLSLVFQSSKFSFFLLYILALPVMICIDNILAIWLTNIPSYSSSFVNWSLMFCLVEAMSAPLWTSVNATGKIRVYQQLMSIIILLNLPLSYIFLKLGFNPISVLIIRFLLGVLSHFTRIIYLQKVIDFPILKYLKTVQIPCIVVACLAIPIPLYFHSFKIGVFYTIAISIITTITVIYLVGLNHTEKKAIPAFIKSRFQQKV